MKIQTKKDAKMISSFGIIMMLFSLMSGIAGVVSQNYANEQNIKNQKQMQADQYEFSEQAAENATQRSEDLYWRLQSPEAKVNQLKQAGLSPGLMYGNGGGISGTIPAAAQATTPSLPMAQINPLLGQQDFLGKMLESVSTDSQKELNQKEIELKDKEKEEIDSKINVNTATINEITSQTNLNNVRTQNEAIDGQIKQLDLEYSRATQEDRIKIVTQTLDNLQKENEKILEEIYSAQIDNENKQKLYDAQIQKYKAETAKIWKEKMLIEAQTQVEKAKEYLTMNQAKLSYAERKKVWTEINKIESEIGVCEAQVIKLLSDADLNNVKQVSETIGQFTSVVNTAVNIANLAKPNAQ